MSIDSANDEFFSSIVRDIKNYDGKDPLRPWIEGIKKMESTLPQNVLKEKLPRFLQKCIQTFQSDRRYRNDSRYVGVWIQLMDFVENPKALLRMMEKNGIGMKQASFYMAYALFFEKRKMFEAAEKYYYMGSKNLAEPAAELHKAYEKFLYRVEVYKKRMHKLQETDAKVVPNDRQKPSGLDGVERDVLIGVMGKQELQNDCLNVSENLRFIANNYSCSPKEECVSKNDPHSIHIGNEIHERSNESIINSHGFEGFFNDKKKQNSGINRQCSVYSDDTIMVKFVGSAIVGKSEAGDACPHGLVDPTVNMKEAMNAISNMFKEPLELGPKARKKSSHRQSKISEASNGFKVFVDDNCEEVDAIGCCPTFPKGKTGNENQTSSSAGTFKILADEEEEADDSILLHHTVEDFKVQPCQLGAAKCSEGPPILSMEEVRPREDTIIRRFVGSTIFNDPEVENVCHHGLVDPTVNMKEAMNDINGMFGEPIQFARPTRKNRQACYPRQKDAASHGHEFSILADDFSDGQTKVPSSSRTSSKKSCFPRQKDAVSHVHEFSILADDFSDGQTNVPSSSRTSSRKSYQADFPCQKEVNQGFLILADDDTEGQSNIQSSTASLKKNSAESDLFEPTLYTKEAMDEINSLFGKPLDF